MIKKALKISYKILAILLLLFLILFLLISIPAVQTRLGKYVTDRINEDFGTDITIQRIGLQLNGDVELKNILIEDHKQDTLIGIRELNTSILSFKKLMDNKLTFGDIDVQGLKFNIRTYLGEEDTNLDIFVDKLDDGKESNKENPFLLSSSDVSIEDGHFMISDDNKEKTTILDLRELNINATDFVILGPDVKARINQLAFIDKKGLRMEQLSTNFAYTLSDMDFDDLKIRTTASSLEGSLRFEYDREDMQFFEDSVKLSAAFRRSTVDLSELNLFFNEFGGNQTASLTTNLSGTLNDLYATGLMMNAGGRTVVNGDINFKNLFKKDAKGFRMQADFRELSSTYRDLRSMLPNILGRSLPSSIDKLGRFTLRGESTVTPKSVKADLDINTALGLIYSDLDMTKIDEIDNASYTGNIVFDEFDLGTFVEDPKIGRVSMNTDVDGQGFTLNKLNTALDGSIYGLVYNNYYYSNISISGNVRKKVFNGKLNLADTNADMDFNGLVDFSKDDYNYDFVADVRHADLNKLNFIKRDSISTFKGIVDMKMKGTSIDNAYGTISFKNTLYTNQDDAYYFKDFEIGSSFVDNIRYIGINSPDIIEGELSGNFVLNDIFKLVENSFGSIYTNYQPFEIADRQFIDFEFRIYNKIAEVFYPELNLGGNTVIRGRVESDARKFKLNFRSPQISFKENFARNINLKIDNNNPLFNTLVEIDSLHSDFYKLSEFSLVNVTRNDTLFVKSEFTGGKRNTDYFDLSMFYTINEENKSVVGFRRSEIEFKGNEWFLNKANNSKHYVEFERSLKNFNFDVFKLEGEEEAITLSGSVNEGGNKDINLDFENVDLIKISPELEDLVMEGRLNGSAKIKQIEETYLPESKLTINNFKLNGTQLGTFKANIIGNSSLTNYTIDVGLMEDSERKLNIKGNLDVSGRNSSIDVDIDFSEFTLEPLNPFGDGNIDNIRGFVSGKAKVRGNLDRPDITGQLLLDDAGMTIPYLNIDFELDDGTQIGLTEQRFTFNEATLTDTEYFSRASLSGEVSHNNLSNWKLNLDMSSDRLLVLNTEDNEEALYYGTAFVSGNIGIAGPTDQLIIQAEVTSEEGTIFKIPLNDTEAFGDSSFIHFLSPEEKAARVQGEATVIEDIKGLEMDFDLTVNENAEIEIVIDKNSGSTIKGRGNGGLLAQINTNGKFNMYGDFIVSEGTYNFIYGGLIQKEFKVLEGGTLVWEGDPLQAQINIKAVYDKLQANPSILLDNPINRSIPVEVEIHLTGQLEKPDPNFNLRFPNVNTTLNSELQYRLDDNESRQFQALSLLATGSFRSELSFDAGDALGLVSDRAAAILNSLISSGDGTLDVGFDFQLSENSPDFETDSRVGVTLSTKLSDRVLINGKVGVPIGGVSETVVAGDIEIEVLLNEDRTLKLNVFNRENSIRNFGEQIGYTQGLGLSYDVEFDNLEELFQKIFKGNKKEEIKNQPKKEETENGLPEFMEGFKSKDTTSQKSRNF